MILLSCLLVYYLHVCVAIKGAISFSKRGKSSVAVIATTVMSMSIMDLLVA